MAAHCVHAVHAVHWGARTRWSVEGTLGHRVRSRSRPPRDRCAGDRASGCIAMHLPPPPHTRQDVSVVAVLVGNLKREN